MCLTVSQPWAWAIVSGHKRIENRTWTTEHRGDLAIHAGLSHAYDEEGVRVLEALGIEVPPRETWTRGAVVGLVQLVDIVPLAKVRGQPLATGPWCWMLARARTLGRPRPLRGRQGLYPVSLP